MSHLATRTGASQQPPKPRGHKVAGISCRRLPVHQMRQSGRHGQVRSGMALWSIWCHGKDSGWLCICHEGRHSGRGRDAAERSGPCPIDNFGRLRGCEPSAPGAVFVPSGWDGLVLESSMTGPYTATHEPTYASIRREVGPVWSVVWVWPEKLLHGRPLTLTCTHRHRSMSAAVKCARARCAEVRT